MANYCFTAPILPGHEETVKRFIRDNVMNNRDHDRVFHEAGIYQEQLWVQRTPMGDFAVACYGMDNPEKSFRSLATSTDPWAAKFRQVLLEAHGIDLTKPIPVNEQIIDYMETDRTRVTENKNVMK
jgi:hypothetical protein